MSLFSKIGDLFGSIFDKVASIFPMVSTFIKVKMNEGDAEGVRLAGVEVEQLGNSVVELGRLMQAVVDPAGDGGDDITLYEGKQIYDRATAVGDEAGDVISKIKNIVDRF